MYRSRVVSKPRERAGTPKQAQLTPDKIITYDLEPERTKVMKPIKVGFILASA